MWLRYCSVVFSIVGIVNLLYIHTEIAVERTADTMSVRIVILSLLSDMFAHTVANYFFFNPHFLFPNDILSTL
jgi:hypothetical protein